MKITESVATAALRELEAPYVPDFEATLDVTLRNSLNVTKKQSKTWL